MISPYVAVSFINSGLKKSSESQTHLLSYKTKEKGKIISCFLNITKVKNKQACSYREIEQYFNTKRIHTSIVINKNIKPLVPPTLAFWRLVSESQQERWDDAKNLEIFKYNVESLAPLKKFKLQGTTQDKDKNNYIRFLYPNPCLNLTRGRAKVKGLFIYLSIMLTEKYTLGVL